MNGLLSLLGKINHGGDLEGEVKSFVPVLWLLLMASVRAALTFIESAISKHNVVVFSKTTCPFSILAKRILTEAGVENMKVYEIERRQDGWEIQVSRFVIADIPTLPIRHLSMALMQI